MSGPDESPDAQRRVNRVLPAAEPGAVADFVAELNLREADAATQTGAADAASSTDASVLDRPRLVLNMVATVDGRAALDGRTASLGNWADRELFHALRAEADVVLVGAGTVREERYGRIVRDPDSRARRTQAGRSEEPLAAIVSGSLSLSTQLPLLNAPEARVVILTNSDAELPPTAAAVEYLRTPGGQVDLAGAMAQLRARFGAELVLCEGGPRLNADLLRAGLVDELFLSVSPQLAGGSDALRIVYGPELVPPVELQLVSVLESESHLFLRYAVVMR